MGEMHDIIGDIVDDRQSATTNVVVNIRTGARFFAEVDSTPDPLRVVTELGEDVREVCLLHVNDDTQAAGIISQDIVTFTLFGRSCRHRILKRSNDPTTPTTDFWAQYIAPDKDTN